MSWITRLRGMWQAERLDRELDEELRSHIEMRTADNIAAGMSTGEARLDARRRFGNAVQMKESTRAVDIVGWMENVGRDMRYALRMLRRDPSFSIVAVLTLALGIGANVATFSVVHAVLLSPLPYPHSEQLVRVYDDLRTTNTHDVGMSVPEMWDFRDRSGVFQDISGAWPADSNLTGGDHPERIQLLATSAGYFTMLGVRPQLGRVYTEKDAQPGFTLDVVISDGFWKRNFGGRPNVLGKEIRVDGDLYTIVGVAPAGFRHPGRTLPNEVDVWAAAGFYGAPFSEGSQRSLRMLPGAMGRLKPGLTVAQAQARLDAFTARMSQDYPNEYPAAVGWSTRLVSVQEDLVGNVGRELLVLFGAVAFVLLIACVNLANLLFARSIGRQREIAIRLALGAGRGRLIGQMLTESVLLAAISGLVALLAVRWLETGLLKLAPADFPRVSEVSLNPGVLVFAFFLSILTGVLFGLVPALQAARGNQVTKLREGSFGTGASKHQLTISRFFVSSEIALSLVLLIGAGLLLQSFWRVIRVRPGFDANRVITAKLWLPVLNDSTQDPYAVPEKRAAFLQEVLRRVRALPGVEEAALGTPTSLPMGSSRSQLPFTIENRAAEVDRAPVAEFSSASPEYFNLLKTPLLRGRLFTDADDLRGQFAVLINETLAQRYWPGGDPVGQSIRFRFRGDPKALATIVGVVADIRTDGFDVESAPHVYLSSFQNPGYGTVLFLRSGADPGTLGDAVRREVQAVDPGVPLFSVRSMDEVVASTLSERRFVLELLAVFAAIALLLASIGTYGVMAYTFSQRTREIGIRMAMGAQRRDILGMALGEGVRLIVFGVATGLAGSLLLTRFLQSMLFNVAATDPVTFSAIAVILAGVALLACFVPAVRATRVAPLAALRYE